MRIKKKWLIVPPWQGTPVGEVLGSLEKVFLLQGTPITSDKQSVVIRVQIEGRNFYVKRYHQTLGLRSWLGRSRIRVEARNQLWFSQVGLPAAKVVAYGEEYLCSKTLRGCLVTEEQIGTRDLSWTAVNKPECFKSAMWVTSVTQQLAEITRTLHDFGFCHNDLKWRNILVTQDLATPQLYLIDCPTGQYWPRLFLERRIIKDLACLDKVGKYHLSRTQRLRFFKMYVQIERFSMTEKKRIRRIVDFFKDRE